MPTSTPFAAFAFGRLPDWAGSEAATRSVATIAANPCFADLRERMSKAEAGLQSPVDGFVAEALSELFFAGELVFVSAFSDFSDFASFEDSDSDLSPFVALPA